MARPREEDGSMVQIIENTLKKFTESYWMDRTPKIERRRKKHDAAISKYQNEFKNFIQDMCDRYPKSLIAAFEGEWGKIYLNKISKNFPCHDYVAVKLDEARSKLRNLKRERLFEHKRAAGDFDDVSNEFNRIQQEIERRQAEDKLIRAVREEDRRAREEHARQLNAMNASLLEEKKQIDYLEEGAILSSIPNPTLAQRIDTFVNFYLADKEQNKLEAKDALLSYADIESKGALIKYASPDQENKNRGAVAGPFFIAQNNMQLDTQRLVNWIVTDIIFKHCQNVLKNIENNLSDFNRIPFHQVKALLEFKKPENPGDYKSVLSRFSDVQQSIHQELSNRGLTVTAKLGENLDKARSESREISEIINTSVQKINSSPGRIASP